LEKNSNLLLEERNLSEKKRPFGVGIFLNKVRGKRKGKNRQPENCKYLIAGADPEKKTTFFYNCAGEKKKSEKKGGNTLIKTTRTSEKKGLS